MEIQCCSLELGHADLIMTGNLSVETQACIRNVKDLVIATTPAIALSLGIEASEALSLVRRGYDLHVHVDYGYSPITVTYIMGAMYMAMVSLLVGRTPRDDTIIFGAVGNAGSLNGRWELQRMFFTVCRNKGYRRVIIGAGITLPKDAKERAEAIHPDGKPWVDVITVDMVVDAVPLYFN